MTAPHRDSTGAAAQSAGHERDAPAPLFDLERIVAGIRRRRNICIAFALGGLLCGVVLTLLMPPQPTAVVRLMVVHEEDSAAADGGPAETDVALLESSRIAGGALQRLDERETTPKELLDSYTGAALTDNVIGVTVHGDSEEAALARAGALAETFIADHLVRLRESVQTQLDEIRQRRAEVESELASAGGDTQQAELGSRLNELSRRAQEIAMAVPRAEAGTETVDGPRPATDSLLVAAARNTLVGLVLGAGTGLALAALATAVRDRPVLRRDIAHHLGVSVIAQLPGTPAIKRLRGVGDAAERARLAATLARLAGEHGRALSLLQLGCPRSTAALAMDMAGRLTAGGKVVVVDTLPDGDISSGAVERPEGVETRDATQLPAPEMRQGPYLGVGSVEPGTAWPDVPLLGDSALLVVRPGHASAAWLHTVARQLAHDRIAVLGVVLVRPDPRDRSDGTLWDGLHTALRTSTARTGTAPGSTDSEGDPTEYLPAVGSAVTRNVEV